MSDITPTKELLTVYLRQYKHNYGDGYVAAYDISIEQYISNLIEQLTAKEREIEGLRKMVEEAVPFAEFTSRHSPFKKEREFANTWLDEVFECFAWRIFRCIGKKFTNG